VTYLAIGAALAACAALAGAYWAGDQAGADRAQAKQQSTEAAIAAAARTAGEETDKRITAALSKLRPVYTTIRQETEREIQTRTVYADCRHSPEQLQRLRATLAGGASEPSTAGVRVPASAPTPDR
jgi:hypothetical protein